MAAAPARRAPTRRPATPGPARRPSPSRRPTAVPRRGLALSRPRGAAVLDKLLFGRGWIAIVFVLLAGIVFFNIDLLQMNREIARTAEKAEQVRRQNGLLRTRVARLGSSERIQRVAAEAGLVLPAPGEVRYLRANTAVDAPRAASRLAAGDLAGAESVPAEPAPVAPEPAAQAPVTTAAPVETAPAPPATEPTTPVTAGTPAGAPAGQ